MRSSPVYEFHDISVENFSNIAKALKDFGSEIKWSLMVIPFCEPKRPDMEAFKEQLQTWKSEGNLLYLHGCKHKADYACNRSFFGRIALRLTNGEAEFAGLSSADSAELLGKALEEWQKLGIGEPCGFVAPAWYGSKALFIRCKELGLESYGSRFAIWNNGKGSRLSIPFSAAGIPGMLIPFAKICEKIYLKLYSLGFLPIPRIVKHPEDLCSH